MLIRGTEIKIFEFIVDDKYYYPSPKKIFIEFHKVVSRWEFVKCAFDLGKVIYNLNDWELLAEINRKIHELLIELNKDNP